MNPGGLFVELAVRIELTTPSLRVTCSTFEPRKHFVDFR